MGKVTQVSNGATGLVARTAYNDALESVEVDGTTIDGDGNTGTELTLSDAAIASLALADTALQEISALLVLAETADIPMTDRVGRVIAKASTPVSVSELNVVTAGAFEGAYFIAYLTTQQPTIKDSVTGDPLVLVDLTDNNFNVDELNVTALQYINGEYVLTNTTEPIDLILTETISATRVLDALEKNAYFRLEAASAQDFEIPLDTNLDDPAEFEGAIRQTGAGVITAVGEVGVTINGDPKTNGIESMIFFKRVADDEWDIIGGVA